MSEIVTPAFIATLVLSFISMVGTGLIYARKGKTKMITERTFLLIYAPLLMLLPGISFTYIGWPDMNFFVRLLITIPLAYLGTFYGLFVTRLVHREAEGDSRKEGKDRRI